MSKASRRMYSLSEQSLCVIVIIGLEGTEFTLAGRHVRKYVYVKCCLQRLRGSWTPGPMDKKSISRVPEKMGMSAL